LTVARFQHTATLLPNGKVLVAGGKDFNATVLMSAELYDPASGTWSGTGSLATGRYQHSATLLLNGKVLVAGGQNSGAIASAELYDVGLGFNSAWQPIASKVPTILLSGNVLKISGSRFQGISQASGGNTQDSSSNYPIVQLRGLENSQITFLPVDPTGGWSNTTFTSLPVSGVPLGPALLTVFTNGITSDAKYLVVAKTTPAFTTQASANTTIGNNISDTATLANGSAPTGTIVFTVFGPNDSTCSTTPVFNSISTVTANGNYPSANFSTTAVGTYRFVASYSGDANNNPVAGACNDANESVVVTPAPTPTPTPTPTPSPTPTPTPIPGASVQFSASLYLVGEGDQRVTLTVTRSGDASAAASVGFVTSDSAGSQGCNVFNGLASSRCDYLTSIGTVQFAGDETSKNISIPIIDDSYAEGNETFTVSLNNAAGASLGAQSTATVTIVDNETTTGPNPVDQSSFYVRQHYLDFLNREPDPSGLNFWVINIESCGGDANCRAVKRIDTSAAFFLSIEFQQTGYLVERIYKASYGDASGASTLGGAHQLSVPVVRLNEFLPDTQEIGRGVVVGQGNWQQQLENNKQAFTSEFVQRSRFTTALATSMTPAQFVDRLFLNAGVTPAGNDRTTAINEFGGATTTADVAARSRALRDVAENSTLNQQEFNRAFVLMQFLGYLRRNPNDAPDADYTGYDFWLTKLNQFNGNYGDAEMVKAFILSSEYRQRFGP
jgi:hypothetical protein